MLDIVLFASRTTWHVNSLARSTTWSQWKGAITLSETPIAAFRDSTRNLHDIKTLRMGHKGWHVTHFRLLLPVNQRQFICCTPAFPSHSPSNLWPESAPPFYTYIHWLLNMADSKPADAVMLDVGRKFKK